MLNGDGVLACDTGPRSKRKQALYQLVVATGDAADREGEDDE
jgi:hypothetical protein